MKPYYGPRDGITIYHGDCREVLISVRDFGSVVTSPPYWSLRVYGSEIGKEDTPENWADELAFILTTTRTTLAESGGVMWLNVGDSYAASGKGGGGRQGNRSCWNGVQERTGFRMPPPGYKMKDLTLSPALLAVRLRDLGWYLRSANIYDKMNPTEPLRADRPSVSHEYVFQFTAREHAHQFGGHNGSVWRFAPEPSDHPATMPLGLASRCVSFSTGAILDPFMGSGTTLRAAKDLGRKAIGIEIEERYCEIAAKRMEQGVLQI